MAEPTADQLAAITATLEGIRDQIAGCWEALLAEGRTVGVWGDRPSFERSTPEYHLAGMEEQAYDLAQLLYGALPGLDKVM
jgi:hypothetical protein